MDWQAVSIILSSAATIVGWGAIIGSAWWFWRRRSTFPRVVCTHKIEHYQVDDRNTLIRVLLTVENKGDVLIKLVEGCARIYQMKPWPTKALLEPISEGRSPLKDGQNEIDWPMIVNQDLESPTGPVEVEPGESTEIPFDFVVQGDLEVVVVYSYFRNLNKGKQEIGWDKSTTYVLNKESTAKAGSRKGQV